MIPPPFRHDPAPSVAGTIVQWLAHAAVCGGLRASARVAAGSFA